MNAFAVHAHHNKNFHDAICRLQPDVYYDWKITSLFYVAIHYLKSLAQHRNKSIGNFHFEINSNIREGGQMPLARSARNNYLTLFQYSRTARYEGIEDIDAFISTMRKDYENALQCFKEFEKYMVSSGVRMPQPEKAETTTVPDGASP